MLNGIDVSTWQGTIDWGKAHAAALEFAGIKATESDYPSDRQFVRNWAQARIHSIPRIAYHFFHADQSGGMQARHFHGVVRAAGGFKAGDCAMLDIETTNGVGTNQLITEAEHFVSTFLDSTQCGLYIYTGPWFWHDILGNPRSRTLAKCPLWIATWGPEHGDIDNWPSGPSIWQWSGKGSWPGIVGPVDLNRFLGTRKQYNLLAQFGGRK